jgi:uncharacterized protein YbjT (DUF2867 family)
VEEPRAPVKALIVGASGYNGGNVARRLLSQGHTVRGLVRDPARATPGLDEVVRGDAITGEGLRRALDGVDVAFYFVHALGATRTDERDRQAARAFVKAAVAAHLPRAVFFSTLAPPRGVKTPEYQNNRQIVENILMDGMAGMTVVRGGMVLGAQSRGLRPYLHLVRRLPVLPLGPWASNRIAVLDERSTVECLIAAGTRDELVGRSLDTPASAEPTHEDLVRALVAVLGVRRRVLRTPVSSRRFDAALMAAVTGESYGFCRFLASCNRHDYTVDPARAAPFGDITPVGLRQALRDAVGSAA